MELERRFSLSENAFFGMYICKSQNSNFSASMSTENGNIPVVVKVPKSFNLKEVNDFFEEIRTIVELHHENIVTCHGFYIGTIKPKKPRLICEFVNCGDLENIIERSNF